MSVVTLRVLSAQRSCSFVSGPGVLSQVKAGTCALRQGDLKTARTHFAALQVLASTFNRPASLLVTLQHGSCMRQLPASCRSPFGMLVVCPNCKEICPATA